MYFEENWIIFCIIKFITTMAIDTIGPMTLAKEGLSFLFDSALIWAVFKKKIAAKLRASTIIVIIKEQVLM